MNHATNHARLQVDVCVVVGGRQATGVCGAVEAISGVARFSPRVSRLVSCSATTPRTSSHEASCSATSSRTSSHVAHSHDSELEACYSLYSHTTSPPSPPSQPLSITLTQPLYLNSWPVSRMAIRHLNDEITASLLLSARSVTACQPGPATSQQ